jgi:hypothetical protein
MASLLTPDQTKFAQLLAQQVLSEHSTESEEIIETAFPYLATCLASNSIQDQRLIQLYKK